MPAQRIPWFKMWPEAIDHEKIAQLTDSQFRTWVTALAKASQQPTRWRFASIQHVAVATGRTVRDVKALVEARLLDVSDDGVWVHDWRQWQERYPSDEYSVNPPPTPPEHSLNGAAKTPPTLREDPPEHSDKKKEERRERREGRNRTKEKNPPEGGGAPIDSVSTQGRLAELIGNVRELAPEIEIHGDRGRAGALLKRNPDVDVRQVAEAYVAFHRGEWPGSNWLKQNGALWCAIEDVGGYVKWRSTPARRPKQLSELQYHPGASEAMCVDCGERPQDTRNSDRGHCSVCDMAYRQQRQRGLRAIAPRTGAFGDLAV